MVYPKHIPAFAKPLASDLVFSLPNDNRAIYLTFDDGPHPEITPWVIDQLDAYDAKATFFLVGRNVEKHPQIVQSLLDHGHAIGMHGYNHLNGWKSKNDAYIEDVSRGAKHLKTQLFRPPYGRITRSQAKALKVKYRIIMWSDLSADFDARYSPEKCVRFATRKVKSGSIIVFHDSEKAWPRLETALPQALDFYRTNNYRMESIPPL